MSEPNRDGWLIAVGLAYPVVTFGVLISCGGAMGPLAFSPLAVPLPAVLLALVVVILRAYGVQFRGLAITLFLAWLCVVVVAQLLVFAAASAAV